MNIILLNFCIYRKYLKFLLKIKKIHNSDKILESFIKNKKEKFILQIGGNDGEMGDPLRKFFLKKGNYKSIIIEPLNYYFKRLSMLYHGRKDIKTLKYFVSNFKNKKKIFYIKPKVANQMNGDGPFNNWAHGQGSFSKNFILNEIDKNNFRGESYNDKINFFKKSIIFDYVNTIRISDLKIKKNIINILVIDVQGYELNVLKTINFSKQKFSLIYYEDENLCSENSFLIRKLLNQNNYKLIGFSKTNLCYSLKQPVR